MVAGDITCEVMVKPVPRKKIEGNEEFIWRLQVLRASSTVRSISHFPLSSHHESARPPRRFSPDVLSCLSVGQTTDGLSWKNKYYHSIELAVGSELLNVSASLATFKNEMPWQYLGTFDPSSPSDSNEKLITLFLSPNPCCMT